MQSITTTAGRGVLLWCTAVQPSAAFAGLDDHVGELLHFGGPAGVVQDGEGLQVLGYAAGRS